ncbi:type II toxin-antitoxin system HicB family antitoxin [Methylobacterium trifolii]|uniref:HicB-like antitoxin of toxin-antitoxin system domain-containing protein n=1 Tax=Methylobacterium trifolii TaxID=1003092 RepID=A0ABQ4TTV2_9HYPH|nr:type II toxin-antitoxin system HicB family antitoxin [Methylobacterium trifolii]GJE58344.1 hypothetical protein MPOCJGCO_0423 [Methylobacterium trifolii]
MPRYFALIDGTAGAYGAAFPDCPGCTAMGESLDAVIRNAGEALREWMGDRLAAGGTAPEPRSAESLLASPDAAMLDGPAFTLVSVPLFLDEGRSVRVNLSLDAGALSMIDRAATERGITRSAFLVSAARDKILADG